MRRRVYRSLDRSASVFGIRGRFLWVTAVLGGFALIGGVLAASLSTMLAGVAVGLAGAGAAYLVTLSLQSGTDEKDLVRVIVKRGYPSIYRMSPKHVRNIWKGFNLQGFSRQEDR